MNVQRIKGGQVLAEFTREECARIEALLKTETTNASTEDEFSILECMRSLFDLAAEIAELQITAPGNTFPVIGEQTA